MLRVLTLNLQHGQPGAGAGDGTAVSGSLAGADIHDPATARAVLAALAEEIAELAPDVIALQEVDLGQARSGRLDQAATLAELLGWRYRRFAAAYAGPVAGLRRRPLRTALTGPGDDVLGPARAWLGQGPVGFGNALLSRYPVTVWRVMRLGRGPATLLRRGSPVDPRSYRLFTATARNLLVGRLEPPEGVLPGVDALNLGVTHLATRADTAARQLAAAWSGLAALPGPHLLAGDLNLLADQVAALGVARMLGDGPTFPAARPVRRIDHFLTDPGPAANGPSPTASETAVPEAAASGGGLPVGPRLCAVGGGARAFVVSDHAGTWIDLETAV
ncbi:endonuclease/exonuclease/phosphatase family protein [Actinomyces succiniciruminis]|uniref:Endonuclease/exonuclease/phosphatase protein n=1 Tax=Actinomyces succiniciruminis TaxID=1522002 RepID=A0A1L7RMK9_9ACTO|nr:endonuclease/exonuclease/phosphatase family protein [Actinomyces succiniciruminis]CED92429.1 Endonuclease/exonuclease/phosphatase protein [Actinomyces succiniciruminis]